MQLGKMTLPAKLRLAPGLEVLGALVLGIALARLFWVLSTPAVATFPAATAAPNPDAAARLFGTVAVAASSISAIPNLQLLGVFAPQDGGRGFAILRLDGVRQLGVVLGDEVAPGVRLAEIHSDHVVLQQGSSRQVIPLDTPKVSPQNLGVAAQPSTAAVPAGIVPVTPPQAPTPPQTTTPATPQAAADIARQMMTRRNGGW